MATRARRATAMPCARRRRDRSARDGISRTLLDDGLDLVQGVEGLPALPGAQRAVAESRELEEAGQDTRGRPRHGQPLQGLAQELHRGEPRLPGEAGIRGQALEARIATS